MRADVFIEAALEGCISQPNGESNWRAAGGGLTGDGFPDNDGKNGRVIDVPGADRFIRRVDFFYRSLGAAGGRATVELWGK